MVLAVVMMLEGKGILRRCRPESRVLTTTYLYYCRPARCQGVEPAEVKASEVIQEEPEVATTVLDDLVQVELEDLSDLLNKCLVVPNQLQP